MATDSSVTLTGTIKNAAGTAMASVPVVAKRLQSQAVASSLADSTQYTAESFSATTNSSGVFSITITHALAPTCPLTYRVELPDKRYFILPVLVEDAGGIINVGTILGDVAPSNVRDINITPLIERNRASGNIITKVVTFTENATNTVHTGSVVLPPTAWLHNIQVLSSVLWTGGTATMKVGDTADDDGYFTGIDLKATDLLVGEVLDTSPSTSWGGKEGAYLVAASGRRGPAATNFAKYYAAGSTIAGIVTVGTPATTAGRTFMAVTYSVGEVIAAVSTGP
jgi:hypothetical protein